MSLLEGGEPIKYTIAQKLCQGLLSKERHVRKNSLIDFQKMLEENETFTEKEFHEIFKDTQIHLLNTLRDKSEPVREQSIKFLTFYFIEILPTNDYYLSYLFPILIERIGTVELIEESEEIRLQLVQFMLAILSKYSNSDQLKPFLNDFVAILKETVKDKYPEVKEASCKCIMSLATTLPRDFHMQAENLVQPVLTAVSYQRYKIRIVAIKCIGELVLHSSYKALEDTVGPLAEKLFDQIPLVRRTVAQVGARWLLEYKDRYSFFHKLLPLILTGLNDEVPETREEAHELWAAVGLQYQSENEKDLKDQMDYLLQAPKYYPPDLIRPNLGCRALVQKTVGKLTAALAKELGSWQKDIRFRCSQLLCSVVQHAEEGLIQHLQDLLMAMYPVPCNNTDDEAVVANIIRACEIMAVFVPVDTWKKFILPIIEDGAHFGHLTILAAFIRGTSQEYIASSLREITQVLADTSVRYTRKISFQTQLIKCVQAIQSKYTNELSVDIGQFLFNIIVTVLSVRDEQHNPKISFDLLQELHITLELESCDELWSKYCNFLLKETRNDPQSWTEVTIERCIFEVILIKSGEAFGENLSEIGEILEKCLSESADIESKFKIFIALTTALDNKDLIFKRARCLNEFLKIIVEKVCIPNLVWSSGQTAESMRTLAASCLCSALSPGVEVEVFNSKDILRPLVDRLIPLLFSLDEDASYRSRHLALENLVLLKDNLVAKSDWQNDDLTKIYPHVLHRLDDPVEKVRACAIRALKFLLEDAPEEFQSNTFKAHHELLLDTLLTHFDDDEAAFQAMVLDVLKVMCNFCKEIVGDKVGRHRPLIRNQTGCDEVLKYLQSLSI